jgi:hypothetical protein
LSGPQKITSRENDRLNGEEEYLSNQYLIGEIQMVLFDDYFNYILNKGDFLMSSQQLIHLTKLLLIISLLSFLNFIACSDDDNPTEPETATVTGALNLPDDAAGKTWAVILDNDINGDNGYAFLGMGLCGSGTEVTYSVSDVTTGTYYLYAVVFVVSDGSQGPQFGDFIGIYGGEYPDNAPASPNAQIKSGTNTFDIDLVVMID